MSTCSGVFLVVVTPTADFTSCRLETKTRSREREFGRMMMLLFIAVDKVYSYEILKCIADISDANE